MKSLFLIPTSSKSARKRQMSRLRAFQKKNTRLEGPFSDKGGKLGSIVMQIQERDHGRAGIVSSVMRELSPANQYPCPAIKVPFMIDESALFFDEFRSAGSIVSAKPEKKGKREVRKVNGDDLAILGTALLRRLGQRALFSVIHSLQNGLMPAIAVVENDGARFLSIEGQTEVKLLDSRNIAEVLSDDALSAFLRFKMASGMTLSLSRDVGMGKDPLVPDLHCSLEALRIPFDSMSLPKRLLNEWELRAIGIGHFIHEARRCWSLDDVEGDKRDSRALLRRKSLDVELRSIREITEEELVDSAARDFEEVLEEVNPMICNCHDGVAQRMLETEDGYEKLRRMLIDVCKGCQDNGFLTRFEIGSRIHQHTHDPRDCEMLKKMN